MSDIPMARTALEVIAIDLEHSGQPHIARAVRGVIADYLYREPPIRRAPTNSNKVTPAIRKQVEITAAAHPYMPMQEIATRCDINIGRVSEILAGKKP